MKVVQEIDLPDQVYFYNKVYLYAVMLFLLKDSLALWQYIPEAQHFWEEN